MPFSGIWNSSNLAHSTLWPGHLQGPTRHVVARSFTAPRSATPQMAGPTALGEALGDGGHPSPGRSPGLSKRLGLQPGFLNDTTKYGQYAHPASPYVGRMASPSAEKEHRLDRWLGAHAPPRCKPRRMPSAAGVAVAHSCSRPQSGLFFYVRVDYPIAGCCPVLLGASNLTVAFGMAGGAASGAPAAKSEHRRIRQVLLERNPVPAPNVAVPAFSGKAQPLGREEKRTSHHAVSRSPWGHNC